MLYLRIMSALLGIPIMLGAVFLGGPWYALLMLVVVNLGIFEYSTILQASGYRVPLITSFAGVTLFLAVVYFQLFDLIYPLVMILFTALFVISLFNMDRKSIHDAAISFWGIIYLGGLSGYLILIRMMPEGALYTYMLLAGVWLHDSVAYFIGSKWGLHKFSPSISPKKSVEGSVAGILAAVLLFFSAVILMPDIMPFSPGAGILFGLGIAVFAQLGDLLESALKRQLAVKDSGKLIPGHGGILDRFDSMLLCAPFVYYFFTLLNISL